MNYSRTVICGRLVRDPETRMLESGTKLCSFAVATNRVYLHTGQRKEETTYHAVVVFGKLAEACALYLKKGDTALVDGRLQQRKYEKDGEARYKTEIVASIVQFITTREPRLKSEPAAAGGMELRGEHPDDLILS